MERVIHPKPGIQVIFLNNPRLVFVHIMNLTLENKKLFEISPKAIISKHVKIGKNYYIRDFTKIVDNCTIANNSIIYDNVTILQNCSVGSNCIIQPEVVIGADGFAFERHQNGNLQKFQHIGSVNMGDNVVCSNSSITRGSQSDTIIGEERVLKLMYSFMLLTML
jgi:UDP-3-O-[3-hydroxymyristoyl] glucosamine N-acyltransferase